MGVRTARTLLVKHASTQAKGLLDLKAHIRRPKISLETPNHSSDLGYDPNHVAKRPCLLPSKFIRRQPTPIVSRIKRCNAMLQSVKPLGKVPDDILQYYKTLEPSPSANISSSKCLEHKDANVETDAQSADHKSIAAYESLQRTSPVNEDVEYKLLEYEGVEPALVSVVKDIHKQFNRAPRANTETYCSNGTESRLDPTDEHFPTQFTPAYISFIIQRIRKLCGAELCEEELMQRVHNVLDHGGITKEDTVAWLNECKSSMRSLMSDQSLNSEIDSLLSSIRDRKDDSDLGKTSGPSFMSKSPGKDAFFKEAAVKPSTPYIMSGRFMQLVDRDSLDKIDYTQVGTQPKVQKDTSSGSTLTVPRLTCESLSSFLGIDASRVQSLAEELDCKPDHLTVDEASFILDELSLPYRVTFVESQGSITIKRAEQSLVKRPLVVTIMGHVDHGKTTLLDTLQRSDIVSGEAGRITQKLGAFKLELERGTLVFMDTPGHAAFGRMRDRGVRCADVVILVVAADDGVMPQTKEAIELIKRDRLPFIVAVNKIDLDSGQHVRDMLEETGLDMSSAPMVYISAKYGQNIDGLTASLFNLENKLNLQVDASMPGTAYVFETELHPTIGGCLRAIVRSGAIREGDWLVCGQSYAKVKRLYDTSNRPIKIANPSDIVQLAWSNDSLTAGVFVHQRASRVEAQKMAALVKRRSANAHIQLSKASINFSSDANTPPPEFGVVLRCGDQGGLEAVVEWINEFNKRQRRECDLGYLIERGYMAGGHANPRSLLDTWEPIRVVSSSVGPFNRSDSHFVEAGKVAFLGFSTTVPDGVPRPELVSVHNVIYELFRDIERIFDFYFGPTHIVKPEANMQVTQLGNLSLKGIGKRQAIGTTVTSGTVRIANLCMIIREGKTLQRDLSVHSMQSSRKDVTELVKGDSNNCLVFRNADVEARIGDEIVSYTKEPLPPLFGVVYNYLLD
ncbi:translation initiation factor IF-2 [Babesia ovis]|uniref:Translation initiation factor IF-2 n=1 Tax=Babesia ovis TaxID=5869 RepID=A0A9W5TCQ3_BABOV|nr:translation initiation factor IF-2 [Babesia ovis]